MTVFLAFIYTLGLLGVSLVMFQFAGCALCATDKRPPAWWAMFALLGVVLTAALASPTDFSRAAVWPAYCGLIAAVASALLLRFNTAHEVYESMSFVGGQVAQTANRYAVWRGLAALVAVLAMATAVGLSVWQGVFVLAHP